MKHISKILIPGLLAATFSASAALPEAGPTRISYQGDPEIIGNCINSNPGYGMYSMRTSGSQLTKLAAVPAFHGSGVYVNGRYYGCDYDTDASYNISYVRWMVYDAQTWHCESTVECPKDYSCVAVDRTYDRTTGTVYSINYDRSGNAIWLATTSLADGSPTYIAPLSEDVLTIAAAPDGQLFGIDTTARLWKISKTDASLTLVGSTNIIPSYETNYPQSITIDPKTGKLYWAEFHTEGMFTAAAALYEVDTLTATAVKLHDIDGNPELMGIYIADYLGEGVPALPAEVAANPSAEGSLTYTFTFRLPTMTADGGTLGGQTISAEVSLDGDLLDILEGTAGSILSSGPHTLTEGLHTLKVTAENAQGTSESAALLFFAGWDIPSAPGDLTLRASGNRASLSWSAPTEGARKGAIRNPITYEIVRLPDNTTLATGLTATQYVDEVAQAGRHAYEVRAVSPEGKSAPATTPYVGLGEYPVPYSTSFNTVDDFNLYTIVDVAGTDKVWNYDESNKRMRHPWCGDKATDDYAVSPAFSLDGDKAYKLSFNAYQMVDSYNEHVQLWHGSSPDPADMEMVLDTGKLPTEPTRYEAVFAPAATGPHYFAFRSNAPKNGFMSYVDDVELVESGISSVPAPVSDLKAVGAPDGVLRIDISFTAPTTTMRGAPLTELASIDIIDGPSGRQLHRFTSPAPGASLSWSDTEAEQGIHVYKVVARTAQGAGQEETVQGFAGIDVPNPVSDLEMTGETGAMTLSWNAPEAGVNGGNMQGVVAYRIDRVVNAVAQNIAEGLTATTLTDNWECDTQAFVYYTVTATTAVGDSDPVSTRTFAAGHPYSLPYAESFAGGHPSTEPWSVEQVVGAQGSWKITTKGEDPYVSAQDGDSGMATFDGYHSWTNGCELRLVSPALDFSEWNDPTLTFWMYHFNGQGWSDTDPVGETMTVEASAENEPFAKVAGADYESYAPKNGWTEHTLDLSALAGKGNVRLAFRGKGAGNFNIHIDNIKVEATQPYVSAAGTIGEEIFSVRSLAGTIGWSGAADGIRIFDINGRQIVESGADSGCARIAPGLYIVVSGNRTLKTIVK